MFGGRLTLLAGGPVIDRDVTSSTLYYSPHTGNTANGVTFTSGPTDEVGLSLSLSGKSVGVYDVFLGSGPSIVLGPKWLDYGKGKYGEGKYSDPRRASPLSRLNGILVNSDGYPYLGTILVDGAGGTCTANVTYGASRKWGVWNAYNQQPIALSAGVTGGKYLVATAIPAWGMVAGNSGNKLTLVCGAPQRIRLEMQMSRCIRAGYGSADTNGQHQFGIGWNQSVAPDSTWSGYTLELYSLPSTECLNVGISSSEHFDTQPFAGAGTAYALENGHGSAYAWSGLRDMVLTAKWLG